MKYNSILILSLICLLLNSCQKAPQDLLVGTWEVSSKTTNTTGSTETTIEKPVLYYKFEEWGEGRIISLETSTELQEMDDWFFTYVYDKEKSIIEFETWTKKEKSFWLVDKLTNVSFTCHASSNGSSTTFNGKKMK
jgi:hypothetical protein